ncbi:MAG: hypothetical protein QM778_01125 [Myxococcales bacterium]
MDIELHGRAQKQVGVCTVTDELKTKHDTNELVLDWDDDAVDSWEQELDKSAMAEAAPFPTRVEPKTTPPAPEQNERATLPPLPPLTFGKVPLPPLKAPSKALLNPLPPVAPNLPVTALPKPSSDGLPSLPPDARTTSAPPAFNYARDGRSELPDYARTDSGRPRMYRPPSEDERKELEAMGSRTLPPPANGPALSWRDDDDDDGDNTRIAAIPRELIEAIARADAADRDLARRHKDEESFDVDMGLSDKEERGLESLASFASETFESEVSSSLSLDTDEAFSLRSSLPAPAPVVSEAPQIEIGTTDPFDDDDDFGDIPDDDNGNFGGDDDIDDVPTGMHSLAPTSLSPADLNSVPAKPLFVPPRPPAALGAAKKAPATREEPSVLRNLEELAPPSEPPPAAAAAPEAPVLASPQAAASAPAIALEDQQVLAALRKIRAQKRRADVLPLVATDEAGKRARIELLQSLSAHNSGSEAANLLVSAAEIAESLNDVELARSLYEGAVALAPDLTAGHQGLARIALASGDMAVLVELLERRAGQASSTGERARALAAVARVRWLVQRDFPAALRAATEAERLAKDDPSYAHLLARIESAANPGAADGTLSRLAESASDPEMACLWWLNAGRALEARRELASALTCYVRAAARSPSSLEAQLAMARTSLANSQREIAARALDNLVPGLPTGALRDAVERRAAMLRANGPDNDVSKLAESTDAVAVRTAAELSLQHADAGMRERAVRRWVETAVGTERALAQLVLAEVRAAAGELGESEEALTAALASDPTFALIPVVRELLARKYGGSLSVAQTGTEDALSSAAQWARDPAHSQREIDALMRARGDHLSPECTETLLLDAAVEAADLERARATLRAESERGAGEERVSSLLTLADYERRFGSADQVRDALVAASELDARNVLVARALLRSEAPNEHKVRVLRREAEASSGARAAFLLLRAAKALVDAPSERLEVTAAAHEAAPAYAPAMWAVHQESRKQGDVERLSNLHAREAGRAKDPHEAIAHLVRAALVRAGDDADAAAAQLTRALDLMPSDPVLRELVIRLGDAVPATLRAEALQSSAERAPLALKRPATLAAAAAFEDASQPARALALFEAVLQEQPNDPIAEMGVERVARAAGKAGQLAEQKRRGLAAAVEPRAQRKALEALLEATGGGDPGEQLSFARSLLALVPQHPAALRVLERHAMGANDLDALWEVEERLAATSAGAKDRLARLRLMSLLALRGPEKPTERLDELILESGMKAGRGLWLGRQLMATGAARGDVSAIRKAAELTSASVSDQAELSTLAVQAVALLARTPGSGATEALGAMRELVPTHPTLVETLAEAHEANGQLAEAADLFAEAARSSHTKRRVARLNYRAGILLQEQLNAPDRAREAYQRAAEADIAYKDVQARLELLLSGHNDLSGLVALAEARLNAAQAPQLRVELARKLAQLYEKQDGLDKAVNVLRSALELLPEDLPALSQFEGLLDRANNQRERAEILVRMARLSRDPDELCDVFYKLGEIYDEHLPDPRRAEAAYRRVIKLAPKHQRALEKLSALLKRGGQIDLAAESLERLMQVAERADQRRDVAFELSKLKEDAADFRGAEEVLERLRKGTPTDLTVLRAQAEFYRRRQAQSALAMHLNRAANDLRHALQTQPDVAELWSTLVEVLEQRGRKDAASAVASAASALGLADAKLSRLLDADGGTNGLGTAAFSELLDDLVFTDLLPGSVRILFRHGAEAMNRAQPLDIKLLAGEKLERKHPLRAVASEFAKTSGLGDAEVFVTSQLPYAFVPVSEAPFQILVGRTILGALSPQEQRFLVARACKIARSQMSITCRLRPEEMSPLLGGLIAAQVPDYRVPGVETAMLDEMARRIGKHLSKRAREDMLPHAVELAGQPELDLTRAYSLASAAANRAALLATGSMPAALGALIKLGGIVNLARPQASVLSEIEEAKDLLSFAIAETHFEARQRAGAERR